MPQQLAARSLTSLAWVCRHACTPTPSCPGPDRLARAQGAEVVVLEKPFTFEDVRALLGLRQLVARTADDDLFLVRDVVVQHLLQRKHARRAVQGGEAQVQRGEQVGVAGVTNHGGAFAKSGAARATLGEGR